MKRRILIWGGLVLAMALVVALILQITGESDTTIKSDSISKEADSESEILNVRKNDWTKGNRDAKFVVIKYSDFRCPACRFFAAADNQLAQELGDEVLFVFRHFPLSNSPVSMLAAQYSEAAGRQGKFWEMHDLIYINQQLWANSNPESIFREFVNVLNLDIDQFNIDLQDPVITEKIKADHDGGVALGVRAVPSIYINGKKIRNPSSLQAYRAAVETYLE